MPPKRRRSQLSDFDDEDDDRQSDSLNDWSANDEFLLGRTSEPELRLWRLTKSIYGIDAFQLVPSSERADFTSEIMMELPNGTGVANPNWSFRVAQKLIAIISCPVFVGETGLKCLHYAMKMAKYSRLLKARTDGIEIEVPPKPNLPRGDLHEDWEYLELIQRATEAHIKDWGGAAAEQITYRDLEAIAEAWDLYRDNRRDLSLEMLKIYQNRLPRLPRGSGNGEALIWKKAAILRARAKNIPSPECGMPSPFDSTPERPRDRPPPPRRLRGIHQLRRSRSQRQPEQAGNSSGHEQSASLEVPSGLRKSPDHVNWHRLNDSPRRGHYRQSNPLPDIQSSGPSRNLVEVRHLSRHNSPRQPSPSPEHKHSPGYSPPRRSSASPEHNGSHENRDSDPFAGSFPPRHSHTAEPSPTENSPRSSRPYQFDYDSSEEQHRYDRPSEPHNPDTSQSITVGPELAGEYTELGNQSWEDL